MSNRTFEYLLNESELASQAMTKPMNAIYVCPRKDIECGDRPENWCPICPLHPPKAMTANAQTDEELIAELQVYGWDTTAVKAAARLRELLAENARMKQRETLYLGPDCAGFIVKDQGYVPACTQYKAENAGLREAIAQHEAERQRLMGEHTKWTLDHQAEVDDAAKFIRTIGEELVNAGGKSGDRTVQLANLRSLISDRDVLHTMAAKHLQKREEAEADRDQWKARYKNIEDSQFALVQELNGQKARAEAAEKDAARYRRVRDYHMPHHPVRLIAPGFPRSAAQSPGWKEWIDAAIDAALTKEPK